MGAHALARAVEPTFFVINAGEALNDEKEEVSYTSGLSPDSPVLSYLMDAQQLGLVGLWENLCVACGLWLVACSL